MGWRRGGAEVRKGGGWRGGGVEGGRGGGGEGWMDEGMGRPTDSQIEVSSTLSI